METKPGYWCGCRFLGSNLAYLNKFFDYHQINYGKHYINNKSCCKQFKR